MQIRPLPLPTLFVLWTLLFAPLSMANIARPSVADAPRSVETIQSVLAALEARDELDFVRQTHVLFSLFNYLDDEATHGTSDYWTTLEEFLRQGGGDCEDFALAKFQVLVQGGVASNRLRLAYTVDPKTLVKHMVLLYVPGQLDQALVLDSNHPNNLIPLDSYNQDVAFSFNAKELTIHRKSGPVTRTLGDEISYQRWSEWLERSGNA